tara:strand:+ start:882 stop:1163 length:282 start_codon:yes stop_codon:yes gene_type:complete
MPPCSIGALTYLGKYERNVYKVQLLQKVATVIAINGGFFRSLNNGIEEAEIFEGASVSIKFNSSFDRFLLSSGKDVTLEFQKKYQKIPKNPKE